MATSPITYRISPEVDAELKRLAQVHGGTDKALRVLLGMDSTTAPVSANIDDIDYATSIKDHRPPLWKRGPRPKGDKQR